MDVLAEVKESKSLVDNASDQDQEKEIIEPEKSVGLCRECGEKEPISPGSPYCASCMARRANEARKAKKLDSERLKGRMNTQGRGKAKKTTVTEMTASIEIDFSGYQEVLEGMKKQAKIELRTLNAQIIYILMNNLKECKLL